VRSASTAAIGLDAAQRRSARVPQKFRRCALGVAFVAGDDLCAVVEHRVEERLPLACELVGELAGLALGEEPGLVPLGDVDATSLNEVIAQALPQPLALLAGRGL
jgi:hypothetical protein